MIETRKSNANARHGMTADEVQTLAKRALSVLADGGQPPPAQTPSLERHLQMLCDAYLSPEEDLRHDAIHRLRTDRISPREIIDHVVPAIAERLGQMWFADEISFVDVTIGTARLQETVRALSERQQQTGRQAAQAPVLLVLPKPEQHTLGAFVAAEQFRRLGFRVDIAVDETPRQIAARLRARRYCLVGITASSRRTLASTKELVDIIKRTVTRVTPIVVGGTILGSEPDVLAITNADFMAPDARTALKQCGLLTAGMEPSSIVTADHVD